MLRSAGILAIASLSASTAPLLADAIIAADNRRLESAAHVILDDNFVEWHELRRPDLPSIFIDQMERSDGFIRDDASSGFTFARQNSSWTNSTTPFLTSIADQFFAEGAAESSVSRDTLQMSAMATAGTTSTFEVTFILGSHHFYQFDGSLLAGYPLGAIGDTTGFAQAAVVLTRGDVQIQSIAATLAAPSEDDAFASLFDVGGLLEPGEYTLTIFAATSADAPLATTASGNSSTFAQYDVSLSLTSTSIPEPATLALAAAPLTLHPRRRLSR